MYIDSSSYNTGEKRLYKNMEAKGYKYSEITVDGQIIGTWRKAITQPSTEPNYTQVKEQIQEVKTPLIPMTEEHSAQILKGTKVITNRSARLEDGKYTMPSGDIITLKYLGEAKVNPKTNIVTITNEKTGLVTTRTLDQFAKAEGFKDAADFRKRSILSQSLINGSTTRFIYQVTPAGSTTTVGEEL